MELSELPQDLQEVVEYHTHLCAGVFIGYRACKYAVDLIGKSDKMVVVASNAGCGNDAVKVLLNCSEQEGTLKIKAEKRQAWSFYNCEEEEGATLILNPGLKDKMSPGNKGLGELLNLPDNVLFIVQPFQPECE